MATAEETVEPRETGNIVPGMLEYVGGSFPTMWGGFFYVDSKIYDNVVDSVANYQPELAAFAAEHPELGKAGFTLTGIAIMLDGGRRVYAASHGETMTESAKKYYQERKDQLSEFLE